MPTRKPTVLFLCYDNSARSPLAEALLRHRAGDRFTCCSAGLVPKPVHPLVRDVLCEIGVQPGELVSKRLRGFLGHAGIRFAILLRTPDETGAPRIFPFATRTVRWDVPDPRCEGLSRDEALAALRRTRDDVHARLRAWLEHLEPVASRSSAA